jgi:hypothetical protein
MELFFCQSFVDTNNNGNNTMNTPLLINIFNHFLDQELSPLEVCEEMLTNTDTNPFDGRNALQWATYTINQGEHEGETILAIMGTEFNPFGFQEQIIADLWSVPMATDLIRNMADDAKNIALEQNATYITGHSLGGIIAEMVCSLTGIPGASFGAIGAFDPYSQDDKDWVDAIVSTTDGIQQQLDVMTNAFLWLGFPVDDVADLIDSYDGEDLKDTLISLEYNGLIDTTYHDGVKFEVVLNSYDALARAIGSADGSACSHIAQSCDVRWTWFGGLPTLVPFPNPTQTLSSVWSYFSVYTLGHSSAHYAYNTNMEWTRGYEDYSTASIDRTKIVLPGVEKNLPCGFCDGGEYCESGICNSHYLMCEEQGGGIPTFCPATAAGGDESRADCQEDSDCHSRRCELHSNVGWAALGYNQCYDKLPNNSWCNEDSDCQSGNCSWWWRCA